MLSRITRSNPCTGFLLGLGVAEPACALSHATSERVDAAAMTQAMAHLHAGGLTTQQGYALLNNLVDNQAYMLSANDIFYVSGFLFVVLAGLVWLARPSKSGGGAGKEAAAGAH